MNTPATVTIAAAAAALCAQVALAQAQPVPPQGALPLAEIIAGIEKSQPVATFEEVEWDSDGYWEVEFVDTENRNISMRIDPMTGELWTRKP
ncbi:putative membrane protein YkoI [Amaricoccus macauensis]|uniref:Putative membrane protein YkoI n=1 Tax=Amaricoccus macauensis TaxID=57001 RepID=A0A840SFM0_9RHOB|nr:PepSY domain-containing protein [Amaricoccus macauensis]MBB5221729.1 putative membrane protein YkoI [Amaricoccus macauensis]